MNSSKKYEYHPLTLATSFHSVKLLVRMLLKAPEVILGLMLTYLFPPFVMPYIIAALLLYGYCKVSFIEENFFEKENWVELKRHAAFLIAIFIIIFVIVSLAPSPTVPLPHEHHQETSFNPVLEMLFNFLLGMYFTLLASSMLLIDSLDVYDRYNGKSSGKQALFDDANMCKLLALYLVFFLSMTLLIFNSIYLDLDINRAAVSASIFLTSLFFINTYLCHFYTPEIPKVTITKEVYQ